MSAKPMSAWIGTAIRNQSADGTMSPKPSVARVTVDR